jgi:hypothetical protein
VEGGSAGGLSSSVDRNAPDDSSPRRASRADPTKHRIDAANGGAMARRSSRDDQTPRPNQSSERPRPAEHEDRGEQRQRPR